MFSFFERDQGFECIPAWATFLMQVGYYWPKANPGKRRIALISMPCDSAGAGLIALGAMICDLADPQANDVDSHYDKLLRYAFQYLKSCKQCDMACNPIAKNCGYIKQSTGKLRSKDLRGTVEISDQTDFTTREIRWIVPDGRSNHCIVTPTRNYANNYYLENDVPLVLNKSDQELSLNLYKSFFPGSEILTKNLSQSFSGLCLAGRAEGASTTREIYSNIKFILQKELEVKLDQILAVHGWSEGGVSRMAFYNPRSDSFDRHATYPRLVVADGYSSFLKVIHKDIFQNSDIIGVFDRCLAREDLEVLRELISPNQWYEDDEELLLNLPTNTLGISVKIIKRRG